jgi:hypothetical protein
MSETTPKSIADAPNRIRPYIWRAFAAEPDLPCNPEKTSAGESDSKSRRRSFGANAVAACVLRASDHDFKVFARHDHRRVT